MRHSLTAATLAIAAMTAATAALAFPGPVQPAPRSNAVTEVSDLCGPGWHRGPGGMCDRNGFPDLSGPSAADASPYYYHPGRCWWTDAGYGPRRVCVW